MGYRNLRSYILVQLVCIHVCMYSKHFQQSKGQPGMVANPARGELNRENTFSLSSFAPENLVSRGRFGRPVPRQPAHLHTQSESSIINHQSGAYSRDSSRFPRRRPHTTVNRHLVSPEFIRSRNGVPIRLVAKIPPAQGQ